MALSEFAVWSRATKLQLQHWQCSPALNLLEESLQVSGLVVEEFDLVSTLLLLHLASLIVSLSDSFDLALKLDNFV